MAQEQGLQFVILDPSRAVLDVIRLAMLDKLFRIEASA